MDAERLIAEAWSQRTRPTDADKLTLPTLSNALRYALAELLDAVDYEADRSSGAAFAARILATLITNLDEVSEREVIRH
jgi:hypothetical protein